MYNENDSINNFESYLENHQKSLIEEGLSIVKDDPYEALRLYKEANSFYDEVGSVPGDIIDLSIAIVTNVAKTDMNRALNLLDIVDSGFQEELLKILLEKTNNPKHIEFIQNKILEEK